MKTEYCIFDLPRAVKGRGLTGASCGINGNSVKDVYGKGKRMAKPGQGSLVCLSMMHGGEISFLEILVEPP